MKRFIALAALAALAIQPADIIMAEEITEREIMELKHFDVETENAHNNVWVRWEVPEDAAAAETWLIVQAVHADGSTEDLLKTRQLYTAVQGSDYIAYVCQENGFPEHVRFRVEVYNAGDELEAYGESELLDPAEIFPQKEELLIGTDIPEERITSFAWTESGTTAESNNYFYISRISGGISYEASWHDSTGRSKEVSKQLKEDDWQKLLGYLRQGSVVRKYVMDPEIEVLDGSYVGAKIEWQDMKPSEEMYYVFSAADRSGLRQYCESLGSASFPGWIAAGGAFAAAAAVLSAFALKKKKK